MHSRSYPLAAAVIAILALAATSSAQVLSQKKISSGFSGFAGALDLADDFGIDVTELGDLDGDGVPELVVGAGRDDEGELNAGAAWVLFLSPNGTVKHSRKLVGSELNGRFGGAVEGLGDLDGDSVPDLAVGAFQEDGAAINSGIVHVLFLRADATVKSQVKITAAQGGFTGTLATLDRFGGSLACLGDLDGDGVQDLAVGAVGDNGSRGAVWILFLKPDGTVRAHQKIAPAIGGFAHGLDAVDLFGGSSAFLGDLDGDGVGDLAVGATGDDDGGAERGAVWILFLKADGTVKSATKISSLSGGFTGTLDANDRFGFRLANLGDRDCDGSPELAVGAAQDDDGAAENGAVWILHLFPDGTVRSHAKISATQGGFTGALAPGANLCAAGELDLDADGVAELAVGAYSDAGAVTDTGAVWLLKLDPPLTLGGDVNSISLAAGGTQLLSICADPLAFAHYPYLVLGTLSGTAPGIPVAGLTIPLNFDAYFLHTLAAPNTPPLSGSVGLLDAGGQAGATVSLPPLSSPQLAGLVAHHAAVVLDPVYATTHFATNAVAVRLVP